MYHCEQVTLLKGNRVDKIIHFKHIFLKCMVNENLNYCSETIKNSASLILNHISHLFLVINPAFTMHHCCQIVCQIQLAVAAWMQNSV